MERPSSKGRAKKAAAKGSSKTAKPKKTGAAAKKAAKSPAKVPTKTKGAAPKKKIAPRKAAPKKTASKKSAPKKTAPPKRETVLVTGAAGCVGHFIIEELLVRGYAVVATDLPGATLPKGSDHITARPGDMADQSFTASLTTGVDHIINTAAIVDIGLPYDKLAAVNLEAVKTLFRYGRDSGVKRFIHFSSGSIYAESNRPIDEDYLIDPGNDYERTKADSEYFLFSQPKERPPFVSIIRPTLIYGPRGRVLMAAVAPVAPMLRDLSPYFIRLEGGPKTNMVHGHDVARAAVFLLKKAESHGEVYNVADDVSLPFTDFYNVACELFGLKAVGPTIPYPPLSLLRLAKPIISNDDLFKGVNLIAGTLWDRIRKRYSLTDDLRFNLSKEMTAYGTLSVIFNNSKLKSLGFDYRYPDFRTGWADTLAWYKANRWVPTPESME